MCRAQARCVAPRFFFIDSPVAPFWQTDRWWACKRGGGRGRGRGVLDIQEEGVGGKKAVLATATTLFPLRCGKGRGGRTGGGWDDLRHIVVLNLPPFRFRETNSTLCFSDIENTAAQ